MKHTLTLLTTLLLAPLAALEAASAKPNVLFILADDLGWRDLGCCGSKFYDTPNIDRLAARGVRFTNAYSANPYCSPTRASILTGLYPARIGLVSASAHSAKVNLKKQLYASRPADHRLIPPQPVTRLGTDRVTLARAFKAAGYATGHFGKWHLGEAPYDPLQQGFDVDIPHTSAGGPPGGYLDASRLMTQAGLTAREGEHLEDRMAEEAATWMKANKDRPFFLNYWAFSVHGPWQGKPDYVSVFSNKADPSYDQRHPVYAAMVKSLDDAVGRLLTTLDELKLTERTIIVFTSDNGAVARPDKRPGPGAAWANVPLTSNAPLREGKGSIYEGGTRVPTIITWPPALPAGRTSKALFSSVDFFPTLLELCRLPIPEGAKFDGVSQVAALKNEAAPREAIYNYYPYDETAASVRRGNWKLIRFFCANPDFTDRIELYDLAADSGETRNLAADAPEKARELQGLLADWLQQTEAVIPIPNPDYKGP
jgi:arylsulfatase A-like enzyme